jgi:hypothetical protein
MKLHDKLGRAPPFRWQHRGDKADAGHRLLRVSRELTDEQCRNILAHTRERAEPGQQNMTLAIHGRGHATIICDARALDRMNLKARFGVCRAPARASMPAC